MANSFSLSKTLGVGLAAFMATTSQVQASGFQNNESSALEIGRGLAGYGSAADHAGINFANPAGIPFLNKHQLEFSQIGVRGDFDFRHTGAGVDTISGGGAGSLVGKEHDEPAVLAVVPGLHYVFPVNDRMGFGLSVTIPFGLTTDYKKNTVHRMFATKSKLITVDTNLGFGIKLTDDFAVGLGVSGQYADAELDKIVNVTALVGGGEHEADLSANDWSMGWNAGIMWQALEKTRVGLSYRSKITHDLEGTARFKAPALAAFGFVNREAHARVDLPETVLLSFFQQLANDKIDVMFDAAYTRWRRFDRIVVEYDNLGLGVDIPANANVVDQKYKDTMRYSLGMNYHLNDAFTFRAGVVYDESPVRNTQRTARLPGSDRYWVSLGMQYRMMNDALRLDLGYSHIFFEDDVKIREVDAAGNTLTGKYTKSYANLLGFSVIWNI